MKSVKSFSKRLFKNQAGQGATEYILLLVVVVAVVMLFQKQIKSVLSDKISNLGSSISNFGNDSSQ